MIAENQYPRKDFLPEARHSTNAYVEIAGVKHQVTARGDSAEEMAVNYFATVDALSAGYEARSARVRLDPVRVMTLVQCGIEKAAKFQDFDRAQRLVKAGALVISGAVSRDGDAYCVTSQTTTDATYQVNAAGACTCEDWARHATDEETWYCKHGLAVLMVQRLLA